MAQLGNVLDNFGVFLDKKGNTLDTFGVVLDTFGNTKTQKNRISIPKTQLVLSIHKKTGTIILNSNAGFQPAVEDKI